MKVLLLANKVPYPAHDGSSIAIKSMVDGLLQNGADVTLLSLNTHKHYSAPETVEKLRPAQLKLHYQTAQTNISLPGAIYNLLEGSPYHVSRFKQEAYAQKLEELLRKETFDFIQIESLSMAVYLGLLRKHSQARISLRAHNIEHRIWQRHLQNEGNPFRKFYLQLQTQRLARFEVQIFKQVDALVFITPQDRQWAQEIIPHIPPAEVIPCGLNSEDYPVAASAPGPDLAYLASFDWLPNRQGLEWFLREVWPLVQRERPQTTFHYGGRGMPSYLKRTGSDTLKSFDQVPSARDFLAPARLLIVPLLAGSGMRIKILENMALGKAIVSTPVGAEGIDLQEDREIALAQTPEAFASAILKLLEAPGKRKEMGQAARRKLEQSYSNRALGHQLLAFYMEI